MIVIEHDSQRIKIIKPKKNILIKTNHYLDPTLSKEDAIFRWQPTNDSYIRYYEVLQKLNKMKKKFHFRNIYKVMRSKNTYIFQKGQDIKTVWTLAMDAIQMKYELRGGR